MNTQIVTSKIKAGEKPTKAAIDEVMAASKMPINFDDCPETTDEEFAIIDAIIAENKANKKKKSISLRVSENMLQHAKKSIGKGYTGFLSRLLEAAYHDEALVRRCL